MCLKGFMADTVLDRTSMLTLTKEHLVSLLELAVKGQQDTLANMTTMVKLMRDADAAIKRLRDEVAALKAENAVLRSPR